MVETLADLLREAGIEGNPYAPRPGYTPGPYRRGYRPGAELPPIPRRPMAQHEQDARAAVERMQTAQREFTGVSPLQDAGNQVFEMTGLPSMRRFGQEAAQGHIGRAAAEGGMGALALTGFAAGRPSVRSAPRPQRGIFGGRQTVANSGRSAPRASDGSTYPDRLWDKFNTAGVSRTRFGERDGANDVVDAYDAARLNQGVDQDSIFYADDAGGIHSRQPTPAERAQGRWSGNESAPPAGATNVRLPPPQLPPRPPQVDDAGGGGASQASTRPDGGAGAAPSRSDGSTSREIPLQSGEVLQFRAVESDPSLREIHWDIRDTHGYGDDVEALMNAELAIRRRLDFTPGLRQTPEGADLQRQASELSRRRLDAQAAGGDQRRRQSYVPAFRTVERALIEELDANAGRGVTFMFWPDKPGLEPIYAAWARRFNHPAYRVEKAEIGYRIVPTRAPRPDGGASPQSPSVPPSPPRRRP